MNNYSDSFNDVSEAAAAEHRAENERDLNHERADLHTGKRHKHLVSADYTEDGTATGGKGKKDRMSAFDLILLQGSYDEVYRSVADALTNAQADTETAIEAALQALENAKTILAGIQSRAATLPDGTRVYRDEETGQVFTEDGQLVDDDTAASIAWNGNEPSRFEYLDAQNRAEDAQDYVDAWLGYQVRLGEYRNEMEDADDPPSRKRLEEIAQEIEERRPETRAQAIPEAPGTPDEHLDTSMIVAKPPI